MVNGFPVPVWITAFAGGRLRRFPAGFHEIRHKQSQNTEKRDKDSDNGAAEPLLRGDSGGEDKRIQNADAKVRKQKYQHGVFPCQICSGEIIEAFTP